MSQATSTSTTSRRRFLTAAVALSTPVATLPSLAAATAGPDAALIASARAAVELWNAVDRPDFHAGRTEEELDEQADQQLDAADEQFRRVILTRATTLDELEHFRPGVLNDDGGDMTDHLVLSLVRDVLRLSGEAAHV
jgi:hypothetical protein